MFYYLGHDFNEEEIHFMLEKNNLKKNSISIDDVKGLLKEMKQVQVEDIFKAFSFYCGNSDCEINIKDLKNLLKQRKNSFTDEEIQEIARHVECDYEGFFNYEMFINKKLLSD